MHFFLLEIVGFGRIWLNPTRYSRIWLRSLQIWSRSRRIWLVFAGFSQIFLQLRLSSGCSGFGDVNSPLDTPVSVFENGKPSPTDWTFGSGRNRVVVEQFGRVVRLGLDSPNCLVGLFRFSCLVCLYCAALVLQFDVEEKKNSWHLIV